MEEEEKVGRRSWSKLSGISPLDGESHNSEYGDVCQGLGYHTLEVTEHLNMQNCQEKE